MNRVRKQHYIPKMVLKRFSFNSDLIKNKKNKNYNIFAYNTEDNKFECRNIDSISFVKDLYEYIDVSDDYINDVENSLSHMENDWSSILDKIEKNIMLNNDDIIKLNHFMYIQTLRTPTYIKMAQDVGKVMAYDNLNTTESNYVNYFLSLLKCENIVHLADLIDLLLEKFNMQNHKLCILCSSHNNFILNGDNPVLQIINSNNDSFWYLPISPNKCLMFYPDKYYFSFYHHVMYKDVNNIKYCMFESESQYIYCKNKSDLTELISIHST